MLIFYKNRSVNLHNVTEFVKYEDKINFYHAFMSSELGQAFTQLEFFDKDLRDEAFEKIINGYIEGRKAVIL